MQILWSLQSIIMEKWCVIYIMNRFCAAVPSVQSRLAYTVIKSADIGISVEGLAPLLDHVTITECNGAGISYRNRGWGLLTMLECNVSHNSYRTLSVESYSTDAAVYLYRSIFLIFLLRSHK